MSDLRASFDSFCKYADELRVRQASSSRQVGGDHYMDRGSQPWDIIEEWGLDFWEGNALKYLLRRKPGVDRSEDLRKAIHYLERAAERAEEAECNR